MRLPQAQDPILLIGFSSFFLVFRAFNLLSLPIYLDEAIYINWAYMFKEDPGFAYLSMQDGKTPLYFWLVSVVAQWINNPLVAGRLVSTLAGLGTALSTWFLARNFFGRKIAAVTFLFYTITPYPQFIERMAFADSLLTFFGISSLSLITYLAKRKNELRNLLFAFPLGTLIGLLLGFAFLTKSSAKIFVLLVPILVFLQVISNLKKTKTVIALILTASSAILFYKEVLNAFRTGASRFFLNIETKEQLLALSPEEFLKHPFNAFYLKNSLLVLDYLLAYITLPLIFLAIFAIVKSLQKKDLNIVTIIILSLTTLLAIFFSAKTPASRYFLPFVPFLVILSAVGFTQLLAIFKNKALSKYVLFLIALALPFYFDIMIIFNPLRAPFSQEDRHYLFETDLSGVGINEVIQNLETALVQNDVVLGVDMFWGMPDYIDLKIKSKTHAHSFSIKKYAYFNSIWVFGSKKVEKQEEKNCLNEYGELVLSGEKRACQILIPTELIEASKTKKVFLLALTSRNTRDFTATGKTKLLKDIQRPSSPDKESEHLYLYELID